VESIGHVGAKIKKFATHLARWFAKRCEQGRLGGAACRRPLGERAAATRRPPPVGVPGRDLKATPRRNAGADPDETGTPGPLRLRVRAQRYRQPLHDVCTARRLAPRQGHRSPTAVDYAHVLKDLADIHFTNARTIVLVQDNLNIHSKASLYEAFPAAEARRLVERFEWHYTPKHGSWLDLAEPELGVLSGDWSLQ
jgi:DDE superfamily endonuclease